MESPQFGDCEKLKLGDFPCSENGVTLKFSNPQKLDVRLVQFDNCVIKDTPGRKACDFIVIEPSNLYHYVELKGSDVLHAYSQLAESINYIVESYPPHMPAPKCAYAVYKRNRITSTAIDKHTKEFYKKYNAVLFTVKSGSMTVELPRS